MWEAPADIELVFKNERMSKIEVTFTQPPVLTEVITDYEKLFGKPIEKKIATKEAYETSKVRWQIESRGYVLEVTLVEHQGTIGITYELCERKAKNRTD